MRSRYFIFLSLEVSTFLSNPTIKRTVRACIDDTSNVCTRAMDVNDVPISSDDSDISLETQPPFPQVLVRGDSPATNPARSADIPLNPTPRPRERGRPYYDGLSLALSQEQAIQRWRLPRRPEYGTLARHTRTFYQDPGRWDAEGKPSVGSIAAAGF